MSGPVITRGVTLCNPDALTPEQLKQELHRVQIESMEMGNRLHETIVIAQRQAALIDALVDSHEAKDTAAISLQLQRLSDYRQEFKRQGKPPAAH